MQTDFRREHAEMCMRLALGAGDPEMVQQLIATAAHWLSEESTAIPDRSTRLLEHCAAPPAA